MKTISCREASKRLAELMETVDRDRQPITITRKGAEPVVLVTAGEYASMEETLHLLSTPANAERIQQGLADYASSPLLGRDSRR